MKLLFFTSVNAVHAQKWLRSLSVSHEVHVATFLVEQKDRIPGVTYHQLLPVSSQKNAPNGNATTKKQAGATKKQDGLTIKTEAWLTFKNGIRFAKRFAQIIDEVKPDIVHAHQSVPFGWYAVRALTRARHTAPLVVSVWGTDVMAYPEQNWLFRLMDYSVLKHATALTATSQALVAASMRWTKRKDWLVVPFGVEPGLFKKKSAPAGQARVFGMAKQLRFIGESDVYGFTTALRALALAKKQKHDLSLEIAGSGPEETYLKKLADSLGISEAVRFLGHVPQEQLGERMARWDALLLPSKQESFGVVAVEAAAVGIPVIGSRVGGIPEIVQEESTGRLLNPMSSERLAQAMLAVDKKLLQDAFTRGPKLVAERFTWQKSLERMQKVYEALS